MGKHTRPYEDPYQTEDQFDLEVAEMDAIQAMDEGQPASAGHNPRELNNWIAGYVQNTHPAIYREALQARGDEITRMLTRRKAKQEQGAQEIGPYPGPVEDIWTSYAGAIQEADDRTAHEAGGDQQ